MIEIRHLSAGYRTGPVVEDVSIRFEPGEVLILVDTIERPEEIDRVRAERARERAEERLRQKQSVQEYYRSKAALARAMARLKSTK